MTSSSSYQSARIFTRVAHDIAGHSEPTDAIARMLELAQHTTGAASAAMWVRTPLGTAKLRASTDPALTSYVDQLILAQRPGTVIDCLERDAIVWVDDATRSYRWRLDTELSNQSSGLRAIVGYSLTVDAEPFGMLCLASPEPGHFTDDLLEFGALFAQHAALGLEVVNRVCKTRNLEGALESNRRIGVAIGVLMSQRRVTEEMAFDLLRKDSQNAHRKLRDVADDVILTGDLPSAMPRSLAS